MNSLEYYTGKLHSIKNAFGEHLDAILEDGVVDYDEAVETKSVTADFARQVQSLKKELNLDIREMRAEYQLLITNASSGMKAGLRREKVNALAPYERIKLLLDKLLLNIANVKDMSAETIEDIERVAKEAEAVVSTAEEIHPDHENDLVHLEEIKALRTRWRGLLQGVEEALAAGKYSPKQFVLLKTAEHVLHVVLEDVDHVIGE